MVTAVNRGRLLRPWDAGVPAEGSRSKGAGHVHGEGHPPGGAGRWCGGRRLGRPGGNGPGGTSGKPAAFSVGRHGLRDLTHELKTSIPAFAPGEEPVRRTVATIEADGYYMQEWRIIEHIGTHVDAPGHFTPGGRLAPDLEPSELITPAVVVNIADRAARDPDTVVTVDDLRAFERRHGRIPRDSAVLMDSGWGGQGGRRRRLPRRQRGRRPALPRLRRRGHRVAAAPPGHPQPRGRHPQHRPGDLETFDTHLILTGADRYGLENLANLDRIPRRGATIMVGLIPYEDGSGGQARIFASW